MLLPPPPPTQNPYPIFLKISESSHSNAAPASVLHSIQCILMDPYPTFFKNLDQHIHTVTLSSIRTHVS